MSPAPRQDADDSVRRVTVLDERHFALVVEQLVGAMHEDRERLISEMAADRRQIVEEIKELRASMPAAVATGVASVITDESSIETLMGKVGDVAKRRAKRAAADGLLDMLLGGVRALANKWVVVLVICAFAFKAFGWPAAVKVWNVLFDVAK